MARSLTGGSSQYITFANPATFNLERTQAWTIAAVVTPSAGIFGSLLMHEDENGASPGEARGYGVFQRGGTTGPQWAMELSNASSTNRCAVRSSADSAIAVGTSRAVAFTYDGSSAVSGCAIYENGTAIALTTIINALSATVQCTASLRCGAREATGTPSFFWTGVAAEMAMWSVVLTARELAALAAGACPAFIRRASLMLYAPLLGDATEPDYSGSRNNGTVTGATVSRHPAVRSLVAA